MKKNKYHVMFYKKSNLLIISFILTLTIGCQEQMIKRQVKKEVNKTLSGESKILDIQEIDSTIVWADKRLNFDSLNQQISFMNSKLMNLGFDSVLHVQKFRFRNLPDVSRDITEISAALSDSIWRFRMENQRKDTLNFIKLSKANNELNTLKRRVNILDKQLRSKYFIQGKSRGLQKQYSKLQIEVENKGKIYIFNILI